MPSAKAAPKGPLTRPLHFSSVFMISCFSSVAISSRVDAPFECRRAG